jgi:hypothetical protein
MSTEMRAISVMLEIVECQGHVRPAAARVRGGGQFLVPEAETRHTGVRKEHLEKKLGGDIQTEENTAWS